MIKKLERRFKYLIIKLLRIHDKAHSIALGFSLGLLINFVPSFGFGPVVSVAFAKIFRGNTVAGFLGGVSLIWAFPILFYANFLLGDALLSLETTDMIGDISDTEDVLEAGLHLGKAFFIGMFINMLIVGTIIYFSVYALITKYRKKLLMYIYRVWLPQK
jgi:uncharacterized protein (DUF2062 family)